MGIVLCSGMTTYKTSTTRYCASVKIYSGRTIQVNAATPRELIRLLKDYGTGLVQVLKIYEKGKN